MKNIVFFATGFLVLGACGGVYSTEDKGMGYGAEPGLPRGSSCDQQALNLEAYTYSVKGEDFGNEEGELLVAQTQIGLAYDDVRCSAWSSVFIEDGQFSLTLQNFTDGAVYPESLIFIDRDQNGLLDKANEPFFSSWHSLNTQESVLPEDFQMEVVEP